MGTVIRNAAPSVSRTALCKYIDPPPRRRHFLMTHKDTNRLHVLVSKVCMETPTVAPAILIGLDLFRGWYTLYHSILAYINIRASRGLRHQSDEEYHAGDCESQHRAVDVERNSGIRGRVGVDGVRDSLTSRFEGAEQAARARR